MSHPLDWFARRTFALTGFFAALFAASVSAATLHVNDAADFNALPILQAGDVVILHDGIYGALDKTLTSAIADEATAVANPIYVTAATPGGVKVSAPSRITLRGQGIVFAGVDFGPGAGMRDNSSTSPAWIVRTDINSRHMTISHLRFDHCTAGDSYGNWILLSGFNHVVEFCSFAGQNEPVSGPTLLIVRSVSEGGVDVPRQHVVRNNYFGPRECSVSENGYETIRIGDSGSQAHDMGVVVEHNVFYRSIWRSDGVRPNEVEIISNKSRGNTYRYNTFLESYGQITLRHGDACIVEGNFVFGGGYYDGGTIALSSAANTAQSGVRITGEHHLVRNNYFINLRGTGERAAISVLAGYPGFNDGNGSGGDDTYEAAHHLQLYNNTFVDCRELQFGARSRVESSLQPVGVAVFNNVWQGNSTSALVADAGFVLGSSGGNYLYQPTGTFGWMGLTATYSSTVTPDISEAFEHYLIPTGISPVLDQASDALVATNDIRGAARPASGQDIGAFEREVSGGVNRPLLRHEVGASFDGGPFDTFPQPPGFPLTVLTTSLPGAKTGKPYHHTLQAFGGAGPRTWSLVSGVLPAGLSLAGDGTLSGEASSPGEASFTIAVADTTNAPVSQSLTLSVVANSVPGIVTATLPTGEAGSPYAQAVVATGGNGALLWSVASGALPPGLALEEISPSSSRVSGIPTASGTYVFTLLLADEDGDFATRPFSIYIAPFAPAATPAITQQPQSQTAGLGATVTFTAAATGDPSPTFQWRKSGVDLPGATSSSLTLVDVSAANAGSYAVVATNAAGSVSSDAAVLTVYDPATPALAFGGITLVSANQNMRGLVAGAVPFSETTPIHPLAGYTGQAFYGGGFVSGGALMDQWNVFNDNVAGDSLRFRISGPPVNAKNVGLFIWKQADFASPYNTGVAVNLAAPDAALSYAGRRFGAGLSSDLRFIVQANNGSYYISASQGGLPAAFATVALSNPRAGATWFEYNPTTDTIAASPAAPDFSSIRAAGVRMEVVKTGADGGAITAALTEFKVIGGRSFPAITGPTSAFGLVGRPFSWSVNATNSPTNFAFGTLPGGFTADATTGIISGTPTATGNYTTTVRPANASGAGPTTTLTLSFAQPSQAMIPATGLVANFEFSGNANDLAANRGGVVFGATLTADRFGRADSAYAFDGLTQYIEIADHDDFSVPTTGNLTISVWLRPDALVFPKQQGTGYVHWMGKGEPNRHEWTFRMYGTGNSEARENRTSFYLFNPTGSEGAGSYVQQPVTIGEWSHYVAVVNSTADTITWYKNGLQVDQDPFKDSIYNVTPTNGVAPLRIGTRDFASYFKGAVDDLRIYNRVLTLAEVQQLYGDNVGVNRAPTNVSLSNHELAFASASAEALVGTLEATDPDFGDTHVYSLTTGGGVFAIANSALVVGSAPLSAGNHLVVIRATDLGGLFFEKEFTITLAKGSPTITWSSPAPIVYGTLLSAVQLNALASGIGGANLEGTFIYSPALGAVLNAGENQTLSVTFEPAGSAAENYVSASAETTITVTKAAPTIVWALPPAITYGAPLSGAQLNATAIGVGGTPLTGEFTYTPAVGAVLEAGPNQPLGVTFAPTGEDAVNYYSAAGSTTITIERAASTLELGALNQHYDGTPRAVVATTTPASLPVTITYNGSAEPPVYPGTYAVVASIDSTNYNGSAAGELVIGITALVRHSPSVNGTLDGSLQVLLPESVTLNGSASISGDLLVAGTPALQLNGQPLYAGLREGPGAASPASHRITLNGGALMRYLVHRIDPIAFPIVSVPPAPAGTRNVVLNAPGDLAGNFATVRNLTLNGNAGHRAVPPGVYGAFAANGSSGFMLGAAGATEPSIYQLQSLTLNGGASVEIVGPVILVLRDSAMFNGPIGDAAHPDWLTLRITAGGLTLNGSTTLRGQVVAPSGTVTINGAAELVGSVIADRLTINGAGRLRETAP